MTLYKNKYRVESTRLPNRDYAANGLYFITICTEKRQCFFGNVKEFEMQLSPIGEITKHFWSEIPSHFQHTNIDSFVIMPNHVHGIIIIDQPQNVETRNFASLNISDESNKFGALKPGSLQAIVHSYKSAVTRWCRKNGHDNFRWQERFYENVIRADDSLEKIREYIDNNPAKWEYDKDNKANLWM